MKVKVSYYVAYCIKLGRVVFSAKATSDRNQALSDLSDMTAYTAEALERIIVNADAFGIIEIVVDLSDAVEILS